MLRLAILSLILGFTLVNCSNGQNDKPANTKATPKVNPIQKEKAAEVTEVTKETESSTNDQVAEGATPEQLAKAKEVLDGADKKKVADIDAKKIFKIHCSLCHGFKGNMMVNGAKDLTKSKITLQEAVAQVYHGKGLMTPYYGVLSNEEIVAVSKYAETLRK